LRGGGERFSSSCGRSVLLSSLTSGLQDRKKKKGKGKGREKKNARHQLQIVNLTVSFAALTILRFLHQRNQGLKGGRKFFEGKKGGDGSAAFAAFFSYLLQTRFQGRIRKKRKGGKKGKGTYKRPFEWVARADAFLIPYGGLGNDVAAERKKKEGFGGKEDMRYIAYLYLFPESSAAKDAKRRGRGEKEGGGLEEKKKEGGGKKCKFGSGELLSVVYKISPLTRNASPAKSEKKGEIQQRGGGKGEDEIESQAKCVPFICSILYPPAREFAAGRGRKSKIGGERRRAKPASRFMIPVSSFYPQKIAPGRRGGKRGEGVLRKGAMIDGVK